MNWPRPLTGSSYLTAWLNQLLTAARSSEIRPGVGYRVKPMTCAGGLTIELEAQPAAGGKTVNELFLVKSVKRDWIECVTATIEDDGTITEGESTIEIAKPYDLQGYPFWGKKIDGLTYTYDTTGFGPVGAVNPRDFDCQRRSVARSEDSSHKIRTPGIETFNANALFYQELWPAYEPDKTLIIATDVSTFVVNLPDESFEIQGVTVDNPPMQLKKVDLNFAGRHFRDLDFEIPVCVDVGNGQVLKRFIRVRGAHPYSKP